MENEILKPKRNVAIDVIKGMLAVFVVLGHCTCNKTETGYTLITDLCYSFHMFLFIAVSGYLIGSKEKTGEWYLKRFMRLMIPYFVWSLVYGLLAHHSLKVFALNLFFHPYLWYLIVLFICDSIVFVMEQIPVLKSKKKVFIITGIGIFFVLNVVYALVNSLQTIDTFKLPAIYFIFYFAGYVLKKYELNISKKLVYVFAALYPVSMILYQYKAHERQERIARFLLGLTGIAEDKINRLVSILNPTGFVLYNHFIVAVLGCFFFICVGRLLAHFTLPCKVLSFLGKYTLHIYIISGFFILNLTGNGAIDVMISFILGLVVPVIIGIAVHKVNWLDRICFGAVKSVEKKQQIHYN